METLKPELIAPVVAWLCHEECSDNGSIIESAGGWAGKCKNCFIYFETQNNTKYSINVPIFQEKIFTILFEII